MGLIKLNRKHSVIFNFEQWVLAQYEQHFNYKFSYFLDERIYHHASCMLRWQLAIAIFKCWENVCNVKLRCKCSWEKNKKDTKYFYMRWEVNVTQSLSTTLNNDFQVIREVYGVISLAYYTWSPCYLNNHLPGPRARWQISIIWAHTVIRLRQLNLFIRSNVSDLYLFK